MEGVVLTGLALALAAPVFIVQYLARLPYAPECPACRQMTQRQQASERWLDRACASVGATAARCCKRCGWRGRMRWRFAAQRAGTGGPLG